MINEAIKALEFDQWVESIPKPDGEPEDKSAFVAAMLEAFRVRKQKADEIAAKLSKMDLPAEAKAIVDATFAELRIRLDRMGKYVDEAGKEDEPYPHAGAVWYGCVQQPDLDAEHLFSNARDELSALNVS
ncbi:hypothetical protein ACC782_33590 [Rhizobium ruizarguesonis]